MKFWSIFGGLFKAFGAVVMAAMDRAQFHGLTSELVDAAKAWVKVAATKELDNELRRDFVIQMLRNKFPVVPESIIRLAIELAVQAVKKELEKL